jgi:tRNA modification GTPase
MQGDLGNVYDAWMSGLTRLAAYIEAFLDFPEEDIPAQQADAVAMEVANIASAIARHLHASQRGERLRNGFRVAVIGPPNAGKSSLINELAQRDIAIVTPLPGTTRDILEVSLDIGGYPVVLADTAGFRYSGDLIEAEGIRRAVSWMENADARILLADATCLESAESIASEYSHLSFVRACNKIDAYSSVPDGYHPISVRTSLGIDGLLQRLLETLEQSYPKQEPILASRQRHRFLLEQCLHFLEQSRNTKPLELMAEDLRRACLSLGKITGRMDVEDMLDVIFREFCIGK